MTVTGLVQPGGLGLTLPHEHLLVDFADVDTVSADRYDRRVVFKAVRPYLQELAAVGGKTLIECTPKYLGRDPVLLRQLSEATGIQLVTNTGYYGARNDQHVPRHAYSDSVDALANRWTQEWKTGIGATGIRPGFIKIGVDDGSLSTIDRKLVRAACRAHLRTGLTIASHTGPARPAFEQLKVLAEEGVAPSAWVWVHAQNEDDLTQHVEAGKRGAWVAFDGYGLGKTARYVRLVSTMRENGLLGRVLLSHDNGWYAVGEPGGGTFAPYTPLFANLLPALREAGCSQEEIHQLTEVNPAQAFSVRVRAV